MTVSARRESPPIVDSAGFFCAGRAAGIFAKHGSPGASLRPGNPGNYWYFRGRGIILMDAAHRSPLVRVVAATATRTEVLGRARTVTRELHRLLRAVLCASLLVLPAGLMAAERREPPTPAKAADIASVDLFDAIKAKEIEVKLIPKDSTKSTSSSRTRPRNRSPCVCPTRLPACPCWRKRFRVAAAVPRRRRRRHEPEAIHGRRHGRHGWRHGTWAAAWVAWE